MWHVVFVHTVGGRSIQARASFVRGIDFYAELGDNAIVVPVLQYIVLTCIQSSFVVLLP